jgi:hypothetical protein
MVSLHGEIIHEILRGKANKHCKWNWAWMQPMTEGRPWEENEEELQEDGDSRDDEGIRWYTENGNVFGRTNFAVISLNSTSKVK